VEILNNPPEHRVELGPHPVSARSAVVDATGLNRFLQPDRRVPLQGVIAELAAQETRGIQDSLAAKEPLYEMEFKNILFATDFGRSAEREAEYAASLAQKH
jgi:hypothetical protein